LARFAPRASEVLGQRAAIPFLISNRHVVWTGGACVPRFNRKSGKGLVVDLDPNHWTVHPDGDDLAAVCIHRFINRDDDKVTAASYELLITEETAKAADIGIGDEVFMLGRFINHQGREIITPAARFGNISMGPAPIRNCHLNHDQVSYAVEMRSRTGFSGAPVMVYRVRGHSLAEVPNGSEDCWGILGVNWGHILDENGENTWLNGVVPAWKVIELLEVPSLREAFERADEAVARSEGDARIVRSVTAEESESTATFNDDN